MPRSLPGLWQHARVDSSSFDLGEAPDLTEHGSASLAKLPLTSLRTYRAIAREEEERVSYWRRLVQARLDLLDRSADLEEVSIRTLVNSLGETGTGARRQQLLKVTAHDPLPGLPGLGEAWGAAVDTDDPEESDRVRAALESAERQLSEYRAALHQRIDLSTEELISRYQSDPTLVLDLL